MLAIVEHQQHPLVAKARDQPGSVTSVRISRTQHGRQPRRHPCAGRRSAPDRPDRRRVSQFRSSLGDGDTPVVLPIPPGPTIFTRRFREARDERRHGFVPAVFELPRASDCAAPPHDRRAGAPSPMVLHKAAREQRNCSPSRNSDDVVMAALAVGKVSTQSAYLNLSDFCERFDTRLRRLGPSVPPCRPLAVASTRRAGCQSRGCRPHRRIALEAGAAALYTSRKVPN